ncbi:hypothetical protein SAMN05660964_00355 [Thiothrix caldifontis]|uniref:Uncharacterized protein n=1 Tax=Thiothrix caldifontis TaxID=525918 RepID=A0A1H3W9N8_9GAMM|nr:hypothetical protein [Thiothrix caldifontis]SDZ83805.1 hypothetical protein SAMN05660964_00355 [Thiothrix caldifontis]
MPFHGVLPHRQHLFQPQPVQNIGVNDTYAWQLNPEHRHVYNKLALALAQGLQAAPCGIDPLSVGIDAAIPLFVKPITNLLGMSLDAQATTAGDLASGYTQCAPGCFWGEYLVGDHTSTDCLVLAGKVLWFAHTQGAITKDKQRPIYWHIGVRLPALEPLIATFIQTQLPGYTGLCNVEMIGDKVIEMHLRGSNGFFDFYGAHFVPAWVELVDKHLWHGLEFVREGYVYSLFGEGELPADYAEIAAAHGVKAVPDTVTRDRIAILYAGTLDAAEQVAMRLRNYQ